LKLAGALLTMYNRNSRLSRDIAKEVRRNFPGYVFDTVIPRQVCLAEAPMFGKTVMQYAPTSSAAQAYRELAQELVGRSIQDNPAPVDPSPVNEVPNNPVDNNQNPQI